MATSTTLPPDVNRGPMELGITLTLFVLTTLQIGLRLHTRIFLSRAVGWDDWFAVASMVFAAGQIGVTIVMVHYGYGRHIEYLSEDQVLLSLKYLFIAQPVNIFAVGLQKVSIAIALLRLDLGTTYKWVVWAAIIPNVIIVIITVIIIPARCHPIDLNWNIKAPGHCLSAKWNTATGYAQASSNIVCDVAFVVSPIVCLAKVQLSKYNQWALRVIFLVGLFATICSIVKLTCFPALLNTTDPTWAGVPLALWSTAELFIGLMVASAPALKPRYESFMRKFLDLTNISSGRSRRPGYSGGYGNGKYGYGSGNGYGSAYGNGRSVRLGKESDDTEDLKLDYYQKTMGMPTTKTEVSLGSPGFRIKRFPSEDSSEEIILQGITTSDHLKNDQIRITKTVEVQGNPHAL